VSKITDRFFTFFRFNMESIRKFYLKGGKLFKQAFFFGAESNPVLRLMVTC